ncbi:hypothetical protein T4B_1048 [Trichinella pseudospiralis]|uniref:Uncharacterized protein n=2 Tax=Trichinella pseudospiralis TaxID=6337 RepID=A0A0V1GID3_TRIPS|nr:hypothetical protein T4D_16043 [Trichinella pseudospiralis]KRY96626.1 hypothetical protein T4B_1048 [Trichinella pseudospiralis]KRY97980.1 hypothetical protein T4C_12194 [Trichinella pseudospiralis]
MENKNSNKEKKNLRCKVFKPIRNQLHTLLILLRERPSTALFQNSAM